MGSVITLREFNERKQRAFDSKNLPLPCGISCPSCRAELFDSSPQILLTYESGKPARKKVHCPKCGYRDSRIA